MVHVGCCVLKLSCTLSDTIHLPEIFGGLKQAVATSVAEFVAMLAQRGSNVAFSICQSTTLDLTAN